MSDWIGPNRPNDSLDGVELFMATIEEALAPILARLALGPEQREQLIADIATRIMSERSGDDGGFDDDALAAMVRNLGPRKPAGKPGAVVKPQEPYFE